MTTDEYRRHAQAPLDAFLTGCPRLARGRKRAALVRQQDFGGAFLRRHEWAERAARDGWYINAAKRRAVSPAGTFYRYSDVSLTAIEYLAWLKLKMTETGVDQ